MDKLPDDLRRLYEGDSDVALILNVFREIERVYHDALEAMGVTTKSVPVVKNSAEVTVSFRPTSSSAGD